MAKSFKNLSQPGSAATPKPVSERDFFDLTDEAAAAPPTVGKPAVAQASNNTENSSNGGNTDNSSVIDNIGVASSTQEQVLSPAVFPAPAAKSNKNKGLRSNTMPGTPEPALQVEALSRDVRQTFVLSEYHLEQLRDFVHARRSQGDYLYSQKQALQEALDLLFAGTTPAAPRPAQLREREQQRRSRIQQGRQAGSATD